MSLKGAHGEINKTSGTSVSAKLSPTSKIPIPKEKNLVYGYEKITAGSVLKPESTVYVESNLACSPTAYHKEEILARSLEIAFGKNSDGENDDDDVNTPPPAVNPNLSADEKSEEENVAEQVEHDIFAMDDEEDLAKQAEALKLSPKKKNK